MSARNKLLAWISCISSICRTFKNLTSPRVWFGSIRVLFDSHLYNISSTVGASDSRVSGTGEDWIEPVQGQAACSLQWLQHYKARVTRKLRSSTTNCLRLQLHTRTAEFYNSWLRIHQVGKAAINMLILVCWKDVTSHAYAYATK